MYRLKKSYFWLCVCLALGLFLLLVTWQLGMFFGNASHTKKFNRLSRVNYRKSDVVKDRRGSKSELDKNENHQGSSGLISLNEESSGHEFAQREKKREKYKLSTRVPAETHLAKTNKIVKKGKKRKKKKPNESILPEARNLSSKLIRTATTTSSPPTLSPVTLRYSWSEVYGESGCRTNPWRPTLVKLFAEWVQMAKKHNIDYILFYGSLLGALRTGDAIPYDSDIDLLMDVKYFPKMKEISVARDFDSSDGKMRLVVQPEFDHNVSSNARKRYTCEGELTPKMVDQCSFQEPLGRLVKNRIHIDFYHYYDKGSSLEDPSEEDLKTYAKRDMFPLRPCKFMGLDAFCPNKPWKLLKKYFHSDNLDAEYKCRNKIWQDKKGKSAF